MRADMLTNTISTFLVVLTVGKQLDLLTVVAARK